MKIDLVFQEDAVRLIQERITSQDWWLIPVASDQSMDMCEAIEAQFYPGEKNKYSAIFLAPNPARLSVAIAMGHKEVAPAAKMAKFLKLPKHALLRQDVFIAPDLPVDVVKWMFTVFTSPKWESEN